VKAELLKGNTPTLILAVLRDGPLHGYGIAREIERRSKSALQFRESTLYPSLHALEQDGLVVGEWQTAAEGRSKRVYTLTPRGHTALQERTRAWNRFNEAIRTVLEGDSDGRDNPSPHAPGRRLHPAPEPSI
jgi:PadR family transcriptional regulator PadR